jgi:hypothetical protein
VNDTGSGEPLVIYKNPNRPENIVY